MNEINKIESNVLEYTNYLIKENLLNDKIDLNLKELDFVRKYIGLSWPEKEFLFDIIHYISVGTNIIIDNNGKPMSQKEIAEEFNITTRSVQRKCASLIEKKIIHQINVSKQAYYMINPYLFKCGLTLDIVYKLFDLIGYNKNIVSEFSIILNDKKYTINREKDLEKYLISNLDCIEKGLTLIKSQYEVDNGYIDILATDINGTKTIIEIKNKNDDYRLIEQCVYYPRNFNEETRVITIAPDYTNKLFNELNLLGNIEIKSFHVHDNELIIKDFSL